MFTNLIESDSHRQELKRRSSFFLATVAAYALILFVTGIVSIYAYDARLETQTSDLMIDYWIPPVKSAVTPERPSAPHRITSSNTNRAVSKPTRPILYENPENPLKSPERISVDPNPIPPAPPSAIIRRYVSDPVVPQTPGACITCSGNDTSSRVNIPNDTSPPPPITVKPQTQKLAPQILISKAISLPQPPYPPLARQIKVQGPVPVQILVDESGRVISAHSVSGHAFLTHAAEEAAMRARFTPTTYNGQPVKVQGVITYNFVLQ
jgi:TonB family protein